MTTPRRRWIRVGLRVLLLVAIAAIVGTGWCIYQGVSVSLHAETALHATTEACDSVAQYVRQHDGQWPRSWHDLEKLDWPPEKHAIFPWPEKSANLQQFVTIDFAADPDQMAKETIEEFEAIKPIGPCYPYKSCGQVSSLLDSLTQRPAGDTTVDPLP